MRSAVAIGLGMCLLAGCGPRSGLREEYRMQVNVGPQTAWGMGAARFAELAFEKTGGRIRVKPYYGSSLLKGAQLHSAQMVSQGAIDLAFESTINTAPVIPEMNVFCLPFFVGTFDRLDRLESGEMGRLLFDRMRSKGLEPLGWGENGFRQLTNSRRAVRRPEDLDGMRVRVVGSPVFIEIFREMGADPVNMNWADARTALQQGTVDGQENPMGILVGANIFEDQSHVTLWDYAVDPLILYWSKRQWDAFDPDVREALREAAAEACAFQKALVRVGLDGGESAALLRERFGYEPEMPDPVAFLEAKGMTVTRLTDAERRAFAEATSGVRSRWIEKLGAEVASAVREDWGP